MIFVVFFCYLIFNFFKFRFITFESGFYFQIVLFCGTAVAVTLSDNIVITADTVNVFIDVM